MRIRLLYITGDLGPGGLQRQLCNLLENIKKRKQVTAGVVVWSFQDSDVYVPQFRSLNVPIYPMPKHASGIHKMFLLRQLVKTLNPEIIHSYSFYTNIAAWWGGVGTEAITIGSIRNDLNFELAVGHVSGRMNAFWPKVQICNSVAAFKSLKHRKSVFRSTTHFVVRNGLAINKFPNNLAVCKLPRLLALGRLRSEKRWDRLLEAIASLHKQGVVCDVGLAGVGPLHEQLSQQAKNLGIEKSISFLGYQTDVISLLGESLFLVHTAEYEGTPNVIMEAMACGRPIVAVDSGDIPLLVEDGVTGFVVPQEDHHSLTECMKKLILDPGLCQRMGAAGRKKAEKEFSMTRCMAKTLDVYAKLGWKE